MDKNAKERKDYVEEICWCSGKHVLLLGHRVDATASLSMSWDELEGKVAGLALT